MAFKVDTPATFAEKYIIKSIWTNHFPQGSLLPPERELSDLVGVTRTTLREVLQRLSRDGWLTIRQGRQTKVNYFMEASGLNVLDTLVTLDNQGVQHYLFDAFRSVNDIASVFIPIAVKNVAFESGQLIRCISDACEALCMVTKLSEFIACNDKESDLVGILSPIIDKYAEDAPEHCRQLCLASAFSYHNYCLFKGLASQSNNIVYVLMMNGLRNILHQVGNAYFMQAEARELALTFYRELQGYCDAGNPDALAKRIQLYGQDSDAIYSAHHAEILRSVVGEE